MDWLKSTSPNLSEVMPQSKTVSEKLLLKQGQSFLVLNEPSNYRQLLGTLPENVVVATEPKGRHDIVQVFVKSRKDLEQQLPRVKRLLRPAKGFAWITYPKGTSKTMKADVNRDRIRVFAETVGLEAVAIFSVDKDWSALRVNQVDISREGE